MSYEPHADVTIDEDDFVVTVDGDPVDVDDVDEDGGVYTLTLDTTFDDEDAIVITGAEDLAGEVTVTFYTLVFNVNEADGAAECL